MKKKYINPAWRKVRLDQVQRATANAAERQMTPLQQVQEATQNSLIGIKLVVFDSARSGHKCYHELNTPTVIRDIFAAMTEVEFATWIERIYPETKD